MRTRISILAAFAVAIAATAVVATTGSESEARPKQKDFIIAGTDGYGTQECLSSRTDCGRIVANAWCEAKGFASATTYRKLDADEITGSTSGTASKPVDSFMISCK